MGQPAARIGDMTAHGGTITKGEPTVLIGSMPAARIGDLHVCPMSDGPKPHVGGPITLGSMTVLIGGMPAARQGDMATCTGPPDTIALGCMTVLIGDATSAGAGGGSGSGSGEGTTASGVESHYLDVKFVDKGGYPIAGIDYILKKSGSEIARGSIAGVVSRWGIEAGDYDIEIRAITETKWSTKAARVGETVKLTAKVAGFDSGTPGTFFIFERDVEATDDLIATIESSVSGDKIEAEWEYEYVDDTDDVHSGSGGANRSYSAPEYYFVVKVDGVMSRSDLLNYKDWVEITLEDDDGQPIGDAEYRLRLPDGSIRSGRLDANGHKKEEHIPPGNYSVEFPGVGNFTRVE